MYEILENRAIISLVGVDALKFIQNFSTNDIEKINFSYNYLLNDQGRYLFDFFAYIDDNQRVYLDCNKQIAAQLIARLNLYKLRSDVVIKDESDRYITLYSEGPIEHQNALFSLQDPRSKLLGYRSIVEARSKGDFIDSKARLYLADKYEYTIIDGYEDMVPEKSIPIEFAAEEQQALSFTKGCYVGQEVISRAKHQGVIRKKIYKLDFGTNIALPIKLADVTDDAGNKIGKICSNYQNLAIAQLREEKVLGLAEKRAIIDGRVALIIKPEWKE